jgi:hypothetical protein
MKVKDKDEGEKAPRWYIFLDWMGLPVAAFIGAAIAGVLSLLGVNVFLALGAMLGTLVLLAFFIERLMRPTHKRLEKSWLAELSLLRQEEEEYVRSHQCGNEPPEEIEGIPAQRGETYEEYLVRVDALSDVERDNLTGSQY